MSDLTLTEKSIKSLLPSGPSWIGKNSGLMKDLNDGLALQVERDRQSGKNIIKDFYPDTTTQLAEWEYTYRLPSGLLLTDAQRRARLKANIKKITPATYSKTNEIYALSGFNLIARPLLPTEDPRVIASSGDITREYTSVFGESRFGDFVFGGYDEVPGTAEVIVFANGRPGAVSLNYLSVFGESRFGDFVFGDFLGSKILPPDITIPDDEEYWPLIYVIEAPDGDFAQLPVELKEAYEFLTYKIKPLFMWALSRVEYV